MICYEGNYVHGQREGQGKLVESDKTYIGEFSQGEIHGYGV